MTKYLIIQKKDNAFQKWSMTFLELFDSREEAQAKLEDMVNYATEQYGQNYMKIKDYEIIKIEN